MAFVNEYVPEEDINKYNLLGIWLKHHPEYKQEGKPPSVYPGIILLGNVLANTYHHN